MKLNREQVTLHQHITGELKQVRLKQSSLMSTSVQVQVSESQLGK